MESAKTTSGTSQTATDAEPTIAREETLKPGRALVVLNPKAGSAAPDVVKQTLAEVLGPAGWQWDVHETTGEDDLNRVVDAARERGCDLAIAAGGDGTVAAVADSIVGCGIPLAIVPLGTGNVLSLELGIPDEVRLALEVIAGPHRLRDIDAMRVEGRHFVLQIGIGLDSLMIRDTDRESKRRFGRLAYMVTLVRKVFGYRARRYEFVVDGRRRRVRAWQVLVANSGVLGSPQFRWGPQIAPDDGRLDLVVANVKEPLDYLRLTRKLIFGGHHVEDPSLRYFPVHRNVIIRTRRPQPVQADGEIIGETPVRIEVIPAAVRVVVPGGAEPSPAEPTDHATERQIRRAERVQERVKYWLGPVGLLDSKVFLALSPLPRVGPVAEAMKLLARAMNRADALVVGVVLNALLGRKGGWAAVADVVPALQLTNLTVEYPLKRLFSRDRPFITMVTAQVVGPKPSGFSFPSGHSAAAFAAAYLISRRFPSLFSALYALAGTMAFSRMYLGVHYLSDVVVGAASGTAIAMAYRWVLRAGSAALARRRR